MASSAAFRVPANNSRSAPYNDPPKKRRACGDRTVLEIYLIVALVLVCLAAIAFIVAFAIYYQRWDDAQIEQVPQSVPPEVCITPPCLRRASWMKKARDESVNPCDDFYSYACGGWLKSPEGQASGDVFGLVEKDVNKRIADVLGRKVSKDDLQTVQKLKKFFQKCVSCHSCNLLPLFTLFASNGGFPPGSKLKPQTGKVTDISVPTFELSAALAEFMTIGVKAVIEIRPEINLTNSAQMTISIRQGALLFGQGDKFIYEAEPFIAKYESVVGMFIDAIIKPKDPVYAKTVMKQMIDFEKNLAFISLSAQETANEEDLFKPMTIKALNDLVGGKLNFTAVLNQLATKLKLQTTLKFTEKSTVGVYGVDYFKKLGPLLSNKNTTKEVLATYIMWNAFLTLKASMPAEVTAAFEPGVQRWQTCQIIMNKVLQAAVSKVYVDHRLASDAQVQKTAARLEEMVKNIRGSFNDLVDENQWMDDQTKQKAKEKAAAIRDKLLFSQFLMDNKSFEQFHHDWQYDESASFVKNAIEAIGFYSRSMVKGLQSPVNEQSWMYTFPQDVNAAYVRNLNDITIPAAIMQFPFFENDVPQYLSYGAVGVIIGHEVTHAFDNGGRRYDKNGNLSNWWTDDSNKAFDEKAACYVKQFSSYPETVFGQTVPVNGNLTLGENIADGGGIRESFRAYKTLLLQNGKPEPLLPGLDLTQDQLFFLSFAQMYCVNSDDFTMMRNVRTNVHTPAPWRDNGVVSNSPDFARAYNCPAGSNMNPDTKCTVW